MKKSKLLNLNQFIVFTLILLIGYSFVSAKILIYLSENAHSINEEKYGFSHTQIKMFENDLREKTGIESLEFNEENELDYDFWEKPKKGSIKMRKAILGAIDDELNVFIIGNHSNSKEIHFAQTDAGEIEVNTKITTYKVKFDLTDFQSAKKYSDKDAFDSFTLAINLFHEIDHKVSYDINNPLPKFNIRPETSFGNIFGVRENTNYVRAELGLVLRGTKQRFGRIYKGDIYEIDFFNQLGKTKFLRWKLK